MAQFTYPLITQLIGIIARDFPTFLGQFKDPQGNPLTENFNWFDTVQLWPQNSPSLLLYETDDGMNSQSEHTFQQTIPLLCRIQLCGLDRNLLAQSMRAYLGAMTLLMAHYDWQNHTADLVAPVPIPVSLIQLGTITQGVTANVTRIYVARLSFDEFGQRNGEFMMRGTAHITVNQEEVP